MATLQEPIEETRPRIRRDVLFTESPSGVLFHNADGGFSVNGASAYRFATLIVPHLDGRRQVAELCAGLGPKQRDMVVDLVRTLYDRGFARDVPPEDADAESASVPAAVAERFAPQIDYIDHYVGSATERFHRFRDARIAVLGTDPVARWCVLSLIRNGAASVAVQPGMLAAEGFAQISAEAEELRRADCPTEITEITEITELVTEGELSWSHLASHDLVLLAGPDAVQRALPLVRAGIPEGIKLLTAWSFADLAVIGPLMTADSTGCLICAALRLGANGDPAAAADLWSSVAVPGSAPAPRTLTGPLAGMVGNLLAYEVFRVTTGALPAETAGKLLIQDLDSLDAWSEPLFPHPRCPRCVPDAAAEPDRQQLWPPAEAVREPAARTAVELEDPAEVLDHLTSTAVLVQQRAGVFQAFADEAWNQTPIKIGTVRLGLGRGGLRTVTAFDLHHVAGARIRALHAAARVYADHVVPVGGLVPADALDQGGYSRCRVEPARLAVAGGTAAKAADVAHWAPAYRLEAGHSVLVPAAALRTFGAENSSLMCLPTSAGTGTGASPADAVADGLLSALALDALIGAVRGRVPVRSVDLKLLEADAELLFLAKSARNLGVEVELLGLGDRGTRPVPVLLARTRGAHDGEPRWAVGCATRWQEAAVCALRDLLGAVQLDRQLGDGARADLGDPLIADLDPAALSVGGYADPVFTAATGWGEVLRRTRAAGNDILVAPVELPDLAAGGIWVAKVLLVRENTDAR